MSLLPLRIFRPFLLSLSLAFSFITFLDLFNEIVSEIVFVGAKSQLVLNSWLAVYIYDSFLNPVSVRSDFKSLCSLEIERDAFCFWKFKLFLSVYFVNNRRLVAGMEGEASGRNGNRDSKF